MNGTAAMGYFTAEMDLQDVILAAGRLLWRWIR